ncbi:MAG: 8-amino-7-oxononanoate synthase [Hyphomicrobium sp. 32-62-53]|nr:MAG: 8-amino-7-oxononanoate synthase [Hyphomicrobium sp. 12-62-95]OYY00420.1 MAG: 8-amino-7-oxononanoate synthase [Hyphomicrobium sp. 32-62-53]
MHEDHERSLKALAARGRLRALSPRRGIDFSSNDYLGLGSSPELAGAIADSLARGVPVGAGGSRLLRGNDPEHEALEEDAAQFFGAETALYMGGGFAANTAIFATLPQRGDLIVYDDLIHASAHDGMRMSKAETVSAAHNDVGAFRDRIAAWRAGGGTGRVWIAIESLYSMEGDTAPIADFDVLAREMDAMLVIDEAHATGIFGPEGRGLAHTLEGQPHVVSLHTCGKALGVMGALVLAPKTLRDFLVNRARPFIYATAPSPLMAAGVRAALRLAADAPERRALLMERIALFGQALQGQCEIAATGTQIQPVIVKSDARAVAIAGVLQDRGFDVRAVRPPTVPEGTARLRVSLTLNASVDDTYQLVEAISQELKRHPA